MAQRLRIALLIGSSRQYRRDLLCGIAAYARVHGPWSFYHQEQMVGDAVPAWLADWSGDGIIARIETPKLAQEIGRKKLPAIDLLGLHDVPGIPSFDNDSLAVAQLAADHLLDRGFTHFAYSGLPGVHYSDRTGQCFAKYLAAAGHEVNIFGDSRSPKTVAAAKAEMQALLHEDAVAAWIKSLPKPLGLLACNDLRAHQVLNACGKHGIAVPDDVAVIGADNDEVLCELSDPRLTSIDPNAHQMGYEAAAMLDRMIHGEPPPAGRTLIQPAGIIVRQSTDVLAIADRAVATAVRFIREHACDGIDVENVLGSVRLSRSTLERRFAKLLGRSPKSEILRVQLQHVKRFLSETDYPLAKIARLTGFSHVENMCNFFKNKTGKTPGRYRKETRGE
jgi:LacI family transcriptional regulator